MFWRVSLLMPIIAIAASITNSKSFAQDINTLKSGVVRIKNSRLNAVGTGFIIKIDGRNVYIITAAHVVKGDAHPNAYLFSQQHEPLSATVLDREEDDIRGLALLLLKANSRTISGIAALRIGYTSELGNGEVVKIIGFPGSTSIWTVDNGNVKRLEGRSLVLSGAITEGYSGGPVFLNKQAIGLVTDVNQSDGYATRAEVIVTYVNGIVKDLIKDLAPIPKTNTTTDVIEPRTNIGLPEKSGFCQSLSQLITASRNGFAAVAVKKSSSDDDFMSSIALPGPIDANWLSLKYKYVKFSFVSKSEPYHYYNSISQVKLCLPNWKQDESLGKSEFERKEYHFRESEKGVVVQVHQWKGQSSKLYNTYISIFSPDSGFSPR